MGKVMPEIFGSNDYKKRATLFFLSLVLSAITLIAHPAFAKDRVVYVTLDKTPLLTSPTFDAKASATLSAGAKVVVKKEKGKFYYVTTKNGKKGYVLRFRTSTKKPKGASASSSGSADDDDLFGSLEGMDRTAKVEESSSSHSVRGVRSDNSKGGGATDEEAKSSFATMERSGVSGSALERFQKEGKVGKYAR